MRVSVRSLWLGLVLLALVAGAQAQDLDVTFRFLPDLSTTEPPAVVRAFLPGSFNDWGPNDNGRIAVGAPSSMDFVAADNEYRKVVRLRVGNTYEYKIHYHLSADGSNYVWLTDPLNDQTDGTTFNDSVIEVRDPMVFQPAREQEGTGAVQAVSASLLGTQAFTEITFEVDGVAQDGLPFFDAGTGIFRYELPEPAACGVQFKISATDAAARTVSAEVGVVPPAVEDAPRPAGVEDGVTYAADPTKVTLSLFAPHKCFVYVLGDFNDWQAQPEYLMKRDAATPDSVHWWLQIDGLTPGVEYAFQYLVDGDLRIADPYSEKVLDPNADGAIPAATYPNLKPYPVGQTDQIVGVLQTDRQPFPWTDFERPPQQDLVLYELLVRDFIGRHDYATLADTLDYLVRLGVNAVELMPVAEFDGNLSWGYNPGFYFAPDKYYGPADDLKRFIDAAHRRGLAVILDVVYNHATGQSPFVRLYNTGGFGPPTADNPWFNAEAPPGSFSFFYDVNHESTATQYWLDRVNAYWLDAFNVDGFRFDFTKGFTNQPGDGGRYDASRIRLLKRIADRLWAVDPSAYVILEHFGEDREERELAAYRTDEGLPGMMLWNNANFQYNEATMGYHGGGQSNFAHAYFGAGGRGWTLPHLVSYMESHDEQWLMFKNRRFGACANSPFGGSRCDTDPGAYNVRDLPVALDRMKMAGAFFLLLPGPKMLWQFGELGYGFGNQGEQCLKPGDGSNGDCAASAPGRVDAKPIRWDYRADPLRQKLYRTWAALLHLRRAHAVFRSTETQVDLDVDGAVKTIRFSHPAMNVFLIGNFGVAPTEAVSFAFPSEGLWYEYFTGEVRDSAQDDAVSLLPGEFRLYTSVQLPLPEPGLITVGVEDEAEAPQALRLWQNYPNPFNPATTIRYTLPVAGPVRLEVFDVLGRRVAVLVDGVAPPGTREVTFDARGLPGGTYFYRLLSGRRIETRAMLLIK